MSASYGNAVDRVYQGPQLVTLGDARALTGVMGSPNRDNHDSLGPPAYHNANPPAAGGEVDLED